VSLMLSPANSKFMEGTMQDYPCHVNAGEQVLLNIALTTAAVGGRVVSAATGQPVAAAQISLRTADDTNGGRQGGTITGPDGSFRFEGAAAGKYRVSVRADGYANVSSEPFELHAQEDRSDIVVRVSSGLRVSGKVVVEGDKPNWLWLIATANNGTTRDTASVDKGDGTFTFKSMAPGEWSFQLATDLDAEFEQVKLTVSGDVENLVLTFKVKPPPPPAPPGGDAPK